MWRIAWLGAKGVRWGAGPGSGPGTKLQQTAGLGAKGLKPETPKQDTKWCAAKLVRPQNQGSPSRPGPGARASTKTSQAGSDKRARQQGQGQGRPGQGQGQPRASIRAPGPGRVRGTARARQGQGQGPGPEGEGHGGQGRARACLPQQNGPWCPQLCGRGEGPGVSRGRPRGPSNAGPHQPAVARLGLPRRVSLSARPAPAYPKRQESGVAGGLRVEG